MSAEKENVHHRAKERISHKMPHKNPNILILKTFSLHFCQLLDQ